MPRRLLSRLCWPGVRPPQRPKPPEDRRPDGSWLAAIAPVTYTASTPGPLLATVAFALALLAVGIARCERRLFSLCDFRSRTSGAPNPATIFGSSLKAWLKADAGVYTDAAADLESGSSQGFSHAGSALLRGAASGWYRCGWIKLESVGVVHTLIDCLASNVGHAVRVTAADVLEVEAGNGSATVSATHGTALSAGTWYFWEARYDGASVGIALNGGAFTDQAVTYSAGSNAFRIGTTIAGGSYLDGLAQMFSGVDGSVSAGTRTSLYAAGSGVTPATTRTLLGASAFCFSLSESTGARLDTIGGLSLTAVNSPAVAAGKVEWDIAAAGVGNCPVKRWEDVGSAGNDLVQATIGAQPLYTLNGNYPYALYDGVDDELACVVAVPFPLSWWVTAKRTSGQNIASTENGGPLLFYDSSGAGTTLAWFAVSTSDSDTISHGFGSDTVYGIVHQGTTADVSMWVNGSNVKNKTTTSTMVNGTQFQLGGSYAGGSVWGGRMYGAVWADGVPTTAQTSALNVYMKRLAGIA